MSCLFIILTMIKRCMGLARSIITRPVMKWQFGSKKINDIIEELSDKLTEKQLYPNQVQENILKNYIDLTEESYLDHLMKEQKDSTRFNQIDPHIVLMILPTLQKSEAIRQHLLMLYPHLPLLNSKELTLFYQYLLAHKLTIKPKIPPPKPLIDCQGLLVILAQLYPKDFLTEWLKQVPLYDGENTYLIAMGAFSIISGLSENARSKNDAVISRCYARIKEMFMGEDSEARLGVILLGFEMNIPLAEQLLLMDYSLDFYDIDGIKMSLLLIELDKYVKSNYSEVRSRNPTIANNEDDDVQIDVGVDLPKSNNQRKEKKYIYDPSNSEQVKFKLEEYLVRTIHYLLKEEWKSMIKLHTLVQFFAVLKGKKLEGQWQRFSERVMNYTVKKEQLSVLTNLSTEQILGIIECLQSHKINKPSLIKNLLVLLSDRLEQASSSQMIRLAKCLVTYVRLCEDYLIHFRTIVERRKYIFSFEDISKLNEIFKRVQVLFPKPLNY